MCRFFVFVYIFVQCVKIVYFIRNNYVNNFIYDLQLLYKMCIIVMVFGTIVYKVCNIGTDCVTMLNIKQTKQQNGTSR